MTSILKWSFWWRGNSDAWIKTRFWKNASNKDYSTYFTLLGNAELISRIPEEDFFVKSDFYIKSLDRNNKGLPNVVTVEKRIYNAWKS